MPSRSRNPRSATTLSRRRFAAAASATLTGTALGHRATAQGTGPAALDPVSAAYPLTQSDVTLKVLTVWNQSVPRFSEGANSFTRWYTERTRVKISWEVIAPEDADTMLVTRLMGDSPPHVFLGFDSPPLNLVMGSLSGKLVNLAPLINEGMPEYHRLLSQIPEITSAITAPGGEIWSLPSIRQVPGGSYLGTLFVHQPWLDDLGLEAPTTTDALREVLIAFRDRDPNGLGNVIPLAGSPYVNGSDLLDALLQPFVMHHGAPYLTVTNGLVTAAYQDPVWRDGIAWIASLFNEDLLDAGSFDQHPQDLWGKVNDGEPRVGMVAARDWSAFTPFNPNDPGLRWGSYTLLGPISGPRQGPLATHNPYAGVRGGNVMITTACKDPVLACRWTDGLFDLEATLNSQFGLRDTGWRWAAEGEMAADGSPAIWSRLGGSVPQPNVSNRWSTSGPSGFTAPLVNAEFVGGDDPARGNLAALLDATWKPQATPVDRALPPLYPSTDQLTTLYAQEAQIVGFVQDVSKRWAKGEGSVIDEWNGFLAYLDSLGIAEYLATWQREFESRQAR